MTDPWRLHPPLSEQEAHQFREIVEYLDLHPNVAPESPPRARPGSSSRATDDLGWPHFVVIALILLGSAVLTAVLPEPANFIATLVGLLLVASGGLLWGWRTER